MGSEKQGYDFKSMLFVENPFETIELDGIEQEGIEVDIQGWGANHGAFKVLIERLRPLTIIELGTWKGASAIHMGKLCKEFDLHTQILCVDNFIGFPSFYLRKEQAHKEFKLKGGFPRLYWTFMKNVYESGLSDMITRLVQQIAQAAQILSSRGVKADLIYVDGDHSYEGCKRDLKDWTPILAEEGVFLCDDYRWEGAGRAIDEYAEETGATKIVIGNKAILSPKRDVSVLQEIFDELLAKQSAFLERKRNQPASGS